MIQYDLNLFLFGGFPYIEIATIIAATLALLVMKFAPVGDATMPLKASVSNFVLLSSFFLPDIHS